MAGEDLYSVLSRGGGRSAPASLQAPQPVEYHVPEIHRGRWGMPWGAPGRDRTLLAVILFLVWSVALLGIGIAVGRGQRAGASPSAGSPRAEVAPARPYLTVRAHVVGAAQTSRARQMGEAARDALRQRLGGRHEVYVLPRESDLWICVGRFPKEQGLDDSGLKRLAREVAQYAFEFKGKTIPFSGAAPAVVRGSGD